MDQVDQVGLVRLFRLVDRDGRLERPGGDGLEVVGPRVGRAERYADVDATCVRTASAMQKRQRHWRGEQPTRFQDAIDLFEHCGYLCSRVLAAGEAVQRAFIEADVERLVVELQVTDVHGQVYGTRGRPSAADIESARARPRLTFHLDQKLVLVVHDVDDGAARVDVDDMCDAIPVQPFTQPCWAWLTGVPVRIGSSAPLLELPHPT